MGTPAPLTWASGSSPLPQAEPPPRIPPVTAPLRGPAWEDTGVPKWEGQERQGDAPLRGAGLTQAGLCQVLLGTEDLANELEDKSGKQVPREGPGVRADHKSK